MERVFKWEKQQKETKKRYRQIVKFMINFHMFEKKGRSAVLTKER